MTEQERKLLAAALLEWRFVCMVRYTLDWPRLVLAQQAAHSYELNRRGSAN